MKLSEEFCHILLSSLSSPRVDIDLVHNMTQTLLGSYDYMIPDSYSSSSHSSPQLNDEEDIVKVCSQYQNRNALINSMGSIKYKLVKYVYPVLILFGLFGNFVSFLAMFGKFMKEKKSNVSNNNKGS
jgi:hypothetical protein